MTADHPGPRLHCYTSPLEWAAGKLREGRSFAHLPEHHGDPFDRLLVAQAISERIPILTADRALHPYPVKIIWD